MFHRAPWMLITLALPGLAVFPGLAWAADNPRFIDPASSINRVTTLSQNWSDEVSNWFYNVPQGSRLIPYDWFLHLEQAESQDLFRDAAHIRKLGYIARIADPENPDALPIGFTKDAPYEDGTAGLGVTCAACHTREMHYQGTAYLIDGGPTTGDFERLLKSLATALKATAEDDAKFARFAAKVLPAGSRDDLSKALRAGMRAVSTQRTEYNQRNLPLDDKGHFGPGRVDAFGAIFNEVSVTFLGIPQNWRPANAPVSYPCLWDAPLHDRVQWNGAAENKTSPLGEVLFGTSEVGALGRNSGEVLGVFGNAEINAHELLIPRPYASTVNQENLMEIENSLKTLWSPLWPADQFGAINEDLRIKGEILFQDHCSKCHLPIDRDAEVRPVEAQMADVGTDQTMVKNFSRRASTGRLKGRRKTLLGTERFGQEDAVAAILKHVVERVILDPTLSPASIQRTMIAGATLLNPLESIDALNPGYRMTGTITVGGQKLVGRFDSLIAKAGSVSVEGGRFRLLTKDASPSTESQGNDVVDLRSRAGVEAAATRVEEIAVTEPKDGEDDNESFATTVNNATATIAYKARPLNGIWATAPYLHNGSVPNLNELLKPAAQRRKTFHLGSQEFDPVHVGFKEDPNGILFDTSLTGNANSGHEYGADLTDQERRELLEYLKSL